MNEKIIAVLVGEMLIWLFVREIVVQLVAFVQTTFAPGEGLDCRVNPGAVIGRFKANEPFPCKTDRATFVVSKRLARSVERRQYHLVGAARHKCGITSNRPMEKWRWIFSCKPVACRRRRAAIHSSILLCVGRAGPLQCGHVVTGPVRAVVRRGVEIHSRRRQFAGARVPRRGRQSVFCQPRPRLARSGTWTGTN